MAEIRFPPSQIKRVRSSQPTVTVVVTVTPGVFAVATATSFVARAPASRSEAVAKAARAFVPPRTKTGPTPKMTSPSTTAYYGYQELRKA